MKNSNHLTCLENLPNEIFTFDIFPLFSWQELYRIFFGLNQRFSTILKTSNHLNFTVDESNKHHPALTFFNSCIICLKVCLGQFDITPFLALRSLTLQYPSLQQRNSIRPENFPYLEYLNLSYPLEDSILLNLIFSNGFKYLKNCKLDQTTTNYSWHGSPKLRSLSISVHNLYGIICVLHACPNIFRLNIIVYDKPQNNISFTLHSSFSLDLIQYLFIRSTFEIFTSILTFMPNLKSLTFDNRQYSDNKSPELILTSLAKVLTNLRQLDYVYFTINTSIWNGDRNQQTLHPLFRNVRGTGTSIIIASN
ncbi:unnamed protein product [Adineta steineri]|uniref:F-box domain-containing protein n=1 Tax=Adineta steineri TaxID=433720 RepID=A0A814FLG6_9BILA|nr:unnamed protein product [Adineta steineri]CAF0982930.1 unnamed protein product [Adineta steineri]